MKVTAGIRVKNGQPWAQECLAGLSEFVDEIAILDDGSTDDTVAICRSCPKVARLVRWPKSFFHEGLDRNVVLALVKDTEPDWIVMLDIDEVFEPGLPARLPEMLRQEEYAVWGFRMLHFWRGREYFRVDGKWGEETRGHIHPRLFRNQPGLYYPPQPIHGAHILGVEGRAALAESFICHYGYSYWDEVVAKYERYRQVDPGGDYEHLVDERGLQLMSYAELRGGEGASQPCAW